MPGYIYDLNREQQYTPEQSGWQTIPKLAGQMALTASAYYQLESNISLWGISPLGYKVNFTDPKLLGRLNKYTYEHWYSKIPTYKWGERLSKGAKTVSELSGKPIPTVSGGKLDQGWIRFSSEMHNAYDYIGKEMKGLGYANYDKFAKQVKQAKDGEMIKIGQKEVTKEEAKNILSQWKWSSVFSGITSQLEAVQTYQMWDKAFTLTEAIGTQISNSYKNTANMKYYRRLQGISGSVSQQHQNDMSYSRQEEQLIMRAVNNQMVTRQIVNDQGVFGANPYQQIYG